MVAERRTQTADFVRIQRHIHTVAARAVETQVLRHLLHAAFIEVLAVGGLRLNNHHPVRH